MSLGLRDSNSLGAAGLVESTVVPGNLSPSVGGLCIGLPHISGTPVRRLIYKKYWPSEMQFLMIPRESVFRWFSAREVSAI